MNGKFWCVYNWQNISKLTCLQYRSCNGTRNLKERMFQNNKIIAHRIVLVKGPMFLHADSEDSDQTGRMPRLI